MLIRVTNKIIFQTVPKFCMPQVLCFIIYSDKVVMVIMSLENKSAMCLADYRKQLRWYINW